MSILDIVVLRLADTRGLIRVHIRGICICGRFSSPKHTEQSMRMHPSATLVAPIGVSRPDWPSPARTSSNVVPNMPINCACAPCESLKGRVEEYGIVVNSPAPEVARPS